MSYKHDRRARAVTSVVDGAPPSAPTPGMRADDRLGVHYALTLARSL